MDFAEIKRLVKLVESSNIDELEIQEEGLQVRVTKSRYTATTPAPVQIQTTAPVPSRDSGVAEDIAPSTAPESKPANAIEIGAPMVGTFYRSSTPDTDPYVKEGDTVQTGQTLCIIEAMKLMNEIEAEVSGKILKILVENGQPVEFNQPLFLIEKP